MKATLKVHAESGTPVGFFDNNVVTHIDLTDKNAVAIHNGLYEVI